MRANYTVLTGICLLLCVPLGWKAWQIVDRQRHPVPVVRLATVDAGLVRAHPGELLAELRGGRLAPARRLAEIAQRCEVDVLLVCGLDGDDGGAVATALRDEYLQVPQNGQEPLALPHLYSAPGNATQGGMALFSRLPIDREHVRSFRQLRWSAMPDALRPAGSTDAAWRAQPLSSHGHWDVPVQVLGRTLHVLCSQPAAPVLPARADDPVACRNHDETRLWVDYLTPGRDAWIVDDAGVAGGLAEDALCVVVGAFGCDPVDGGGRPEALRSLLALPRLQDAQPRSAGAVEQSKHQWGANAEHQGDPAFDTADLPDAGEAAPGNLRLDFVLPARALPVLGAGVFWPQSWEATAPLLEACAHRLVWVEIGVAGPDAVPR